MATNDITGDTIATRPYSDKYAEGYERIFGKKEPQKDRYFLSATIAGETIEREVTLEEYCMAERRAGFYPKLPSSDPRFMTTPATAGFGSSSSSIGGRIQYAPYA